MAPELDPALRPRAFRVSGAFDTTILLILCRAVAEPSLIDRVQVDFVSGATTWAGAAMKGERWIRSDASGRPRRGLYWRKSSWANTPWRVVLNDRYYPAEQFVTLIHELAHIYLGHIGPSREPGAWPDRRHLPKTPREVEAEVTSALIAEQMGLASETVANALKYGQRPHGLYRWSCSSQRVLDAANRISARAGLPSLRRDTSEWVSACLRVGVVLPRK